MSELQVDFKFSADYLFSTSKQLILSYLLNNISGHFITYAISMPLQNIWEKDGLFQFIRKP